MLLFRKNDHLGLFENRSEAWCGHFRLENQQPVHRIDFPLCCSNSTSKKRGRWTWARLEKLKHAEHLSLALIFYTRESIHLKNLFIFGRRGWSEFANLTISNFKWQARGAVNGQNSILFMLLLETQKGARAGLGGHWTTFSEGNYSKTAADYFLKRSGSITFRISKLCYPVALCPRPLTVFSDCFLEH